ncbi:MAG: PAS domain-containing protein [Bythopirellula sp.]|nr:PAS domain-containing protein [Bythopirellula sp.]
MSNNLIDSKTPISASATALAYGVALVAVSLAGWARWLLNPWLGDAVPYITMFLAIVVAAWYGGLRPALLAMFLGLLLAWWLFVPPRYSFKIVDPADLIGIFAYMIVGSAIAYFGGVMRAAENRSIHAEWLAREQAERLRTTLASIGDGVITTDCEGRVTNLNPVAQSLTGWTNDEAAGKPLEVVFRIVNEETKLPVDNPVTRALLEGVIVGLANHTVLIAKDGTERPIDDSAAPIRCKEGEIVGCVLVFRDISDRKLFEAKQYSSLEQIATTLESITDGFMRYDRDWRIVYVNNEAERINQLPRSALLGKTPWELFPAVVGTKLETEFRRAVAENVTIDFENYYEPWDRWYGIKCYPAPDGGLTTFIREITERKRAEESLRQAEEQLRTITDNVPALISYVDLECRYILNNRAYEDWFGHPRGEISGRHMRDVVGDAAWSVIGPKVEAALAGQTVHYEAQVDYQNAGPKWIDATYIPSRGADGEIGGVVVLVNDITERKQVEEKLLYQKTRLEALTESVLDGILIVAPDGRMVHQNQTFMDIWKFPAEVLEQKSDAAALEWAAGQTADPAGFLARVASIYDHPEAQVREELAMKDGRVYERCGSPIRTGEARLGWVWTFRDITERKQTEEELRLSAELLDNVIDRSPTGFYIVDADFRISHVNADAQARAFRNVNPAIGRRLDDTMRVLWPEPLATEIIDIFRHTLDTGESYRSPGLVSPRADLGTVETYEWQLDRITMPDGRYAVVCYFYDTTRLLQAEALARESEERFHTLADNVSQFAWMARPDGHIYWYNQRWYDYTGTTPATQEGWGWESVHDPAVLPAVNERWNRSLATGELFEMVFPLRGADGIFRPFLTRVVPVKDAEGRVVNWFGTNTDVTEQQEIQEELRFVAAELSAADRRKDEFLATLAHELRNPLAPIRNGLQIIRLAKGDAETIGPDFPDDFPHNGTRFAPHLVKTAVCTLNMPS